MFYNIGQELKLYGRENTALIYWAGGYKEGPKNLNI